MLVLDYNKKVANELQNIPMAFHHIDKQHPFYQMPMHWHRSCEIVRIISGTLTVYMDESSVTVSTGEIVFINQEIIHGYNPSNCVYEVIDFDTDELLQRTSLCKNIFHTFANNNVRILPFHPIHNNDLCTITNRLFSLASLRSSKHDLILLGSLFELLGTIYVNHHYTKRFSTSSNTERFKPLLDYIENSYMNQITLGEMAKISGITVNHFGKIFHNFFEMTPIEFLTSYRIERACILLINTSLSITDISYQCGFYDASYFAKVFKKQKNITPKKYRSTYTTSKKTEV